MSAPHANHTFFLHRSILKYFMQFKENYFGYHQKFADMQVAGERATPNTRATKLGAPVDITQPPDSTKKPVGLEFMEWDTSKFDPRVYRPLAVKVALTLHDIHGHLVKVRLNTVCICTSIVFHTFYLKLSHTLYTQ